jgi:hypothetical protein
MSGSYLGGNTVITVRRSAQDMERRKAHWRRKLAREQRVLSTGARTSPPRRAEAAHGPARARAYVVVEVAAPRVPWLASAPRSTNKTCRST